MYLCVLTADLSTGVQSLLSMMLHGQNREKTKTQRGDSLIYCFKFVVLTAFDNNAVPPQVMLVVNGLKTNIFFLSVP